MSATLAAPRASTPKPVTARTVTGAEHAPHLEWTSIDSVHNTVWLGRVRGVFVGMVEQRGDEFAVTSRMGRRIGVFATLDEAQGAFIKR